MARLPLGWAGLLRSSSPWSGRPSIPPARSLPTRAHRRSPRTTSPPASTSHPSLQPTTLATHSRRALTSTQIDRRPLLLFTVLSPQADRHLSTSLPAPTLPGLGRSTTPSTPSFSAMSTVRGCASSTANSSIDLSPKSSTSPAPTADGNRAVPGRTAAKMQRRISSHPMSRTTTALPTPPYTPSGSEDEPAPETGPVERAHSSSGTLNVDDRAQMDELMSLPCTRRHCGKSRLRWWYHPIL
jgi:hypothetical protein